MEAEYSVRPVRPGYYQVAKFMGNSWPETVYVVILTRRGHLYLNCTCPGAYHGHECKHYRIVMKYLQLGSPIMNTFWVAKDGTVNGFYANVTEAWRKELENVDERPTTPRKRAAGKRRSGRDRGRK